MAAVDAIEDVSARGAGATGNSGRASAALTNGHVNGHVNGRSINGALGPNGAAVVHATAAPTAVQPPPVYGLPLRTSTRVLTVDTDCNIEFADITDDVLRCVAESGVRDGFVVVFSRHTTAGIRINEHEPLLLEDMAKLLEQIAPAAAGYRHDDFSVRTVNLTPNERVNGHSHCRSLLLGASETVPLAAGELLLGRWQRLFLVELDGPNRREIIVQIVGG